MFILRTMVDELESHGYAVEERVVDTSLYGVPAVPPAPHPGRAARRHRRSVAESRRTRSRCGTRSVTCRRSKGGGDRRTEPAAGRSMTGRRRRSSSGCARAWSGADADRVYDHITRPVREDDQRAFELDGPRRPGTRIFQRTCGGTGPTSSTTSTSGLDENGLSRTITAHIAKDGYWYIHPQAGPHPDGPRGGPAADVPGPVPVRRATISRVPADRQRGAARSSANASARRYVSAWLNRSRPDHQRRRSAARSPDGSMPASS